MILQVSETLLEGWNSIFAPCYFDDGVEEHICWAKISHTAAVQFDWDLVTVKAIAYDSHNFQTINHRALRSSVHVCILLPCCILFCCHNNPTLFFWIFKLYVTWQQALKMIYECMCILLSPLLTQVSQVKLTFWVLPLFKVHKNLCKKSSDTAYRTDEASTPSVINS